VTSQGLEVLDRAECMSLLRSESVGRIAVRVAEQPAILPVVYGLLDDDVVFRTDPGMKLIAAVLRTKVAFEVDATDDDTHAGWSVNVVGHAEELRHPDDLDRAEALGIEPWAEGVRQRWVRITSEQVTGRRLLHPPR
jgi:nitroimidazol reductase NimA-like FMN-containing flavoprotein (pyridoxamine 5'-phosphate oxidase superfamily)